MPNLDARVVEPVNGGFRAVVDGLYVNAEDRLHAERVVEVALRAYAKGAQDARREIRSALGLRTWGGDVSCTDR